MQQTSDASRKESLTCGVGVGLMDDKEGQEADDRRQKDRRSGTERRKSPRMNTDRREVDRRSPD